MIEIGFIRSFTARRFARQVRLVHSQRDSLHQGAIGWNFVTRLNDHRIAYHHLLAFNALNQAIAIYRHLLLILGLIEDIELFVCAQLEKEAHRSGQHHRHKNAQRLQQHRKSFVVGKQLVQGNCHRQQQGNQQNANNRVAEFLQKLFPHRVFFGWSQHIIAMLAAALQNLVMGQTISIIALH